MDYIAFFSFVFVTTFTPGPNNILSASTGMRFGYKKALPFLSGVFTGFSLIMMACAFFGKFISFMSSSVTDYAGYAGAVYMIYLAYKILFSTSEELSDEDLLGFRHGFVLQFFNPKVIVYGLTITAAFILPNYGDTVILIFVSFFLAFATFTATSSWALFGSVFSRILKDSRIRFCFNLTMSLLLVYSAAVISGIFKYIH